MSTPLRERDDPQPSDAPSDDGPLKYPPRKLRPPGTDPKKTLTGVATAPTSGVPGSSDAPSDDGPSKYAPRKVRPPGADPKKALPGVATAPISGVPESSEPPWTRKGQPGAFAGHLDSIELRGQLRRGDLIAQSRAPDGSASTQLLVTAVIVATAIGAAAGVIGYRWSLAPKLARGGDRPVEVTVREPAPLASPQAAYRDGDRPDRQIARSVAPALAPASPASTPPPPQPTVPVNAPASFEPSSPPSTSSPPPLDASQIAVMAKRGGEFMANGNIGAARMMLQPAAEAGDAAAAFALAETYDPFVLKKLGAMGMTADVALARRWYEAARTLGSATAPDRLLRLAQQSE